MNYQLETISQWQATRMEMEVVLETETGKAREASSLVEEVKKARRHGAPSSEFAVVLLVMVARLSPRTEAGVEEKRRKKTKKKKRRRRKKKQTKKKKKKRLRERRAVPSVPRACVYPKRPF
jgi:hypothetical protein